MSGPDGALEHIDADTVSLGELARLVWRGRWFVFGCVLVGILVAAIYLHIVTFQYEAELDISPVQSGGDASQRLSSLGDLASLAGVSVPKGDQASEFELYIEGVQSYAVAEALSKKTDMLVRLFPQSWDSENHRWKEDSDRQSVLDGVKNVLGVPVHHSDPSDPAQIESYLEQKVVITQSTKKLLVSITYQNPEPQLAVDFLRTLHEITDGLIRRRALERANQYSQYLNNKLLSVTVSDYRASLTQALMQQENIKMMASSSVPFAAEPFGMPTLPTKPSSPHAAQVLLIFAMLGFVCGIGLCLARGPSKLLFDLRAASRWAARFFGKKRSDG